ncbi:DUF3060 domain-containing protein [Mycobacterium sp. MBM]|nr:DUF3060 domain-containing protein [Mycobacterium sp. MBM]
MNPQDDPEARIRALEPTELGTEHATPTSHGHPAPPPTQSWYGQHPYGQASDGQSPYGADPRLTGYTASHPSGPSGAGFRPWVAIAPIAVVMFLLAGAAAAFVVYSHVSAPDSSGISGGGGMLTDVPVAPVPPAAPTIITLPTDIAAPPSDSDPAPGTIVTISGIGVDRSVNCNDNTVIVSGANNTVDITGQCAAVTVSGFDNMVTAESSGQIAVSGFDNTVTYRTGEPRVSESGSGNSVRRG